MYNGRDIKLDSFRIKGVVISDPANKNPAGSNIVIQDGNRGMVVYYGTTQTYQTGDSILIDVTGDSLIMYRGTLEVKVNGSSPTSVLATGRTVTPQVVPIADLMANYSTLEWTLVRIAGASVTTAGTFSGNKTLTDGTGNVTLYTATGATFSGNALPTGPKTWTGIISQFNTTKQFQIRNMNDVQ
jgi:hypothetical protein